jgi:hypothetical protein
MTPEQFIATWKTATLKERSGSQSHFIDLCKLIGVETPAQADGKGEWYCFERGATKTAGGEGWADVWKRGHFGWEYKGKRKDLGRKPINGRCAFPHGGDRDSSSFSGASRWAAMI